MQQSSRFDVRFAILFFVGLTCLAFPLRLASAADGDTFFSTPNRLIYRTPDGLDLGLGTDSSIDVFFNVKGPAGTVLADAWLASLTITPLPGATGSVLFAPAPLNGIEPNLLPASVNAMLDFDLDFGGKSVGRLGNTANEMIASAIYFPPLLGSPLPITGANGNLTLHDGDGLFSVPIHIASGTSGNFIVAFDVDPRSNAVSHAGPTTATIHPVAQHIAGTLTIIEAVPEPTTAILALTGCLLLVPCRRRRR